jgi:CxxC motif-containing protein (DUF1111 family)
MCRRIAILLFVLGLGLLGLGQAASQEPKNDLLGGQTTIFNQTANAFSQPAPGLERQQQLFFFVGNSFFNQNWVAAPASTQARDGLGPLFNSRSCAGCHFKDGRGRPPETPGEAPTGFLIRLSIPERDLRGAYLPDPNYGGQFQDQSILGGQGEGDFQVIYEEIPGTFADGSPYRLRRPRYELTALQYGDLHPEVMFSPRVANQMIGLGLLEAIPEDHLLALADPNDRDGDGVSGRPNYVWDYHNGRQALGRFGWKANQPHLLQQVSAAFAGDMGISTTLFPGPHCSPAQAFCADLPNGGQPEISDDDLLKVVLYSSVLAVPAQRNADDPQVRWGQELFTTAKCSACHVPRQETGLHPTIPSLSYQVIYPYTDLLLHDMGPDLADGRPDFEANGQEWRTPPLWGIGLFQTVNGHTTYLHDGRARNLEEAILWHGGEALAAQQAFLQMTAEERAALLAFLKSL